MSEKPILPKPSEELPEMVKNPRQLIDFESRRLLERRQRLHNSDETLEQLDNSKFGIALSGGGIRSATINLGILKTLNKFGIIKRADYLSTVSGGGYTGAYVQATLKNEGSFNKLFEDEHIKYMRSRGEYMIPGQGLHKSWNSLILAVAFIVSTLMSWLSPVIVISLIYIVYTVIGKLSQLGSWLPKVHTFFEGLGLLRYSLGVLGIVVFLHLLANLSFKYQIGISRKFNNVESVFFGVGLVWLSIFLLTGLTVEGSLGQFQYWHYLVAGILLLIAGFFTNPNAISFHRFYRTQLADAFLHFTGRFKNIRIKNLFNINSSNENDYLAPYPLINTCLNLQATGDERFAGSKANDYFLLSPMYCGAKLTGYVRTDAAPDYSYMTLPAAITISAAAVNPGMGMYSNKLLSIVMTLFNARLGFWVANPLKKYTRGLVWWPTYFFYELFSLIGTDNRKLNISDGGHIENLAVYELLRRRCRLIIAVDAGADPEFGFSDLENLTIRARNELGVDIHFRDGHIPEEVIRPKPSHGYSEKRFAIADIYQLWEEIRPIDADGNPIQDQAGNTVEVLINYKRVRDLIEALNTDEHREMEEVIANLNVRSNLKDIIDALLIRDPKRARRVINYLTDAPKLQEIFEVLLGMLRETNVSLEKTLESKLRDDVLVRSALSQVVSIVEKRVLNLLKVGTFVYIKSSVTAPEGKPQLGDRNSLAYGTYKYKIYHPSFPHEPTSDQFFDKIQWEAYFQLGQFIGAEVLGDDQLLTFTNKPKEQFSIQQLLDHFNSDVPLFEKREAELVPEQIEEDLVPLQPLPSKAAPPVASEIEESEPVLEEPEVAMSAEMDGNIVGPPAEEAPPAPAEVEKMIVGEEVQYKM
jgi:hypothetical protein